MTSGATLSLRFIIFQYSLPKVGWSNLVPCKHLEMVAIMINVIIITVEPVSIHTYYFLICILIP
jgi:hypothetical protein